MNIKELHKKDMLNSNKFVHILILFVLVKQHSAQIRHLSGKKAEVLYAHVPNTEQKQKGSKGKVGYNSVPNNQQWYNDYDARTVNNNNFEPTNKKATKGNKQYSMTKNNGYYNQIHPFNSEEAISEPKPKPANESNNVYNNDSSGTDNNHKTTKTEKNDKHSMTKNDNYDENYVYHSEEKTTEPIDYVETNNKHHNNNKTTKTNKHHDKDHHSTTTNDNNESYYVDADKQSKEKSDSDNNNSRHSNHSRRSSNSNSRKVVDDHTTSSDTTTYEPSMTKIRGNPVTNAPTRSNSPPPTNKKEESDDTSSYGMLSPAPKPSPKNIPTSTPMLTKTTPSPTIYNNSTFSPTLTSHLTVVDVYSQTTHPTVTTVSPTSIEIEEIETSSPVLERSIPNEGPINVPEPVPAYWFDYNPDSPYGPSHWDKVQIEITDTAHLFSKPYFESMDNECDGKKQSPLDLVQNYKCLDDHKVYTKRGKDDFDSLDFAILPSSLRVNFHHLLDGPQADFSNLTPLIPAVFADIKIKSEHFVNGKQYAGEFQIAHYDNHYKELVIISIFMDDTENEDNQQLEQFILKWEQTSNMQHNKCFDSNLNTDYKSLPDFEMEQIWGSGKSDDSNFDLYRFMTTGWYYGYKGSITIPPCRQDVHWRILDVPMKISKDQTNRMKTILQNSLSKDCKQNSASYNNNVNRPIQKNSYQYIWRCTERDWKLKSNDPVHWFESWPDDYHGWPSN